MSYERQPPSTIHVIFLDLTLSAPLRRALAKFRLDEPEAVDRDARRAENEIGEI